MTIALITTLLPILGSILGKVIPDPAAAAAAEQEMTKAMQAIAESEAKSESWLTRIARPYVLFIITNGLALWFLNNFVIRPYVFYLTGTDLPEIQMPDEVLALFPLCFGIYGGARTIEKVVDMFTNKLLR